MKPGMFQTKNEAGQFYLVLAFAFYCGYLVCDFMEVFG